MAARRGGSERGAGIRMAGCYEQSVRNKSLTVRIREADCADAPAVSRVHVDSWRTTYRGIVPDDYLARLSYERRTNIWMRILSDPESREFHYTLPRMSHAGSPGLRRVARNE